MRKKVQKLPREKVLLIFEWYKHNFGKSKFYHKPLKLRVYHSQGKSDYADKDYGLRGTYNEGTLSIYLGSITTIQNVCKTVGHEYKHYLMNDRDYSYYSKKMKKRGLDKYSVYLNHPHEKRCRKFEEKWGSICFQELKNKLYKNE
jgi:hypothetical protein